ncbi:hypothetical protein XAC3218_470001 [Xanthomonas citri pv. citri]|nr:hypothetical protein XAC3218_470001 [Xanthomonas citri pv. citri]CEH91476.1 hypothetical protein XACG115_1140001 [Xanthomonas citri pv. citri]
MKIPLYYRICMLLGGGGGAHFAKNLKNLRHITVGITVSAESTLYIEVRRHPTWNLGSNYSLSFVRHD